MVKYELKKIFGTFGSKIAIAIAVCMVAVTCWIATDDLDTLWYNDGIGESGHAAVEKLRSARKEWTGPLDEERLVAAMKENQRINATPEAQSDDYHLNNIAYGWKKGISDIRMVVNYFMTDDFFEFDYYLADRIPLDTLGGLYENRIKVLRKALYEEGSNMDNRFSQQEKTWLINQYEALETPMYYDYFTGWWIVIQYIVTIIMFCAMILGYLVAGIFANEFRWKTDALFFSSRFGRTKATKAKIKASFLLITIVYWVSIAVYSLYVLSFLGFDGWNCPVQLDHWKCPFNITFLQEYLLTILGGYLGNLFVSFLAMWISVKTRSSLLAVTTPFLIIFLPPLFLENFRDTWVNTIVALLPDRLLQVSNAVNYFDLYSFGEHVVHAIPILFVGYSLLTLVLPPVIYRAFGKKEIT